MKRVVEKFLKTWEIHDFFLGAIFVENSSEVQIHIILSDEFKINKKGLITIDGINISYEIYNPKMFYENLGTEFQHNLISLRNFYLKGQIVPDNQKIVLKMKQKANVVYGKKFKQYLPTDLILTCSHLRCLNDKYIGYEGDENYRDFLYFNALGMVLQKYVIFLGYADTPPTLVNKNLEEIFFNNSWRKENYWAKFPDSKFATMFDSALDEISENNLTTLVDYVVKKMGNPNQDEWEIYIR